MLTFLKKKKEEELRPLSESQIQEKLYGYIRPTKASPFSESVPAPTQEQMLPIGELFAPPAEERSPFQLSDPERKPKEKSGVPFYKKITLPSWRFSFSSVALPKLPKISFTLPSLPKLSLPKITLPVFQKPVWFQKFERLPLSVLAASFFGAVLLLVAVRGVGQWVSGFFPEQPAIVADKPLALKNERAEPLKVSVVSSNPALSPVEKKKEILPAPAIQKKFYTIQVVVYEDSVPSQKLIQSFQTKRMDAFEKATKTSRGRELYQVFIGHFKTYEEAQAQLAKYRQKNLLSDFPDSFVRPQME